MTKTYFNVADDFAGGLLNIAGHPLAYGAGDVIVIDSDSAEDRAIRDLGLGDLSNYQARVDASTSLVMAGDMVYAGDLSGSAPQLGVQVWSFPLYLSSTPTGAKFRIRPGFAGRVAGISALSLVDATTTSKSGSIGLAILGDDLSDGKVLLTRTGSPTGGNFDLLVSIDGGGEVAVDDVTYNSTVNAFQTLVDATDLAGLVVVGGSAGAWTLTAANASIEVAVDSGDLTGGTSPAVTHTDVTVGGGSRIVGVEGDPATLDLTSSNVSNGGVIAGETIATGSNAKHGNFSADDVIEATYTTSAAFAEGAVLVTVYLLQV